MADGWLRRKQRAAKKVARQSADAMPDGLWTKCSKCGEILFSKDLEKNLRVCRKCGYHYKLSARERIAVTADEGTFEEFAAEVVSCNPLGFPEYEAKIEKGKAATGYTEAIVIGTAKIGDLPVVLGVVDFGFMGGSMGSAYGEKVVRAAEAAIKKRLPLIFFLSSGGARMQEGILSLMQMAKTNAAIAQLNKKGILYVTVLTDPTTAGVHASFASVGDIIIAEPAALIGFAGERVAAQAGVIHRPDNFQRAEFQLENGMVDMIVARKDMKPTLVSILKFCCVEGANAA
jgi:acetyl-CoA carboxylase carboxyl transferase subunit beta